MRLKTMKIAGFDEATILRNLKRQLEEAKNNVKELERRLESEEVDINRRTLKQEIYTAKTTVKELEDEILKRKIPI